MKFVGLAIWKSGWAGTGGMKPLPKPGQDGAQASGA